MRQRARADNLTVCYRKKQIDVIFDASVLSLTMKYPQVLWRLCKAPPKHCWAQHVACVLPPCCDVLRHIGFINLTIFNLEPRTPNMSQHIATRWPNAHNICCSKQCCDMLRWHVSIVWPGLYTEFINQYQDRHKQNWRWFDNSSCSSEKKRSPANEVNSWHFRARCKGRQMCLKTGLKQCSLWTMHIMTSLSLDPCAIYELNFFIASW